MSDPTRRWTDIHLALFEQRIILGFLTLFSLSLIIMDRFTIHNLETKLREKEYILAPGMTQFNKVIPGVIPTEYVKDFAETMARYLGSFAASEVEQRYADLDKYLATDFRIKFREKIKKELSLLASHDVAEMFQVSSTEIKEQNDGFVATVFGKQTRFISGLKVFEGNHVITLSLKGIAPSANQPWAIQIEDISRQSEDDYLKTNKKE